jgi:hypothetical protein
LFWLSSNAGAALPGHQQQRNHGSSHIEIRNRFVSHVLKFFPAIGQSSA